MDEIIRISGQIKTKIVDDRFGVFFLTTCNGWQWTGQPLTRELAKLSIEVLQEYLDTLENNHDIKK
jgi:hypothetical protein